MLKKFSRLFAFTAAVMCMTRPAFAENTVSVTADEGGTAVILSASYDVSADVFSVSYDDNGAVKSIEMKKNTALEAGKEKRVEFKNAGERIFVWDKDQKPLCEVYALGGAGKPENTDNPGVTTSPGVESSPDVTTSPDVTSSPEPTIPPPSIPEDKPEGVICLMGDHIDINGAENVTADGTVLTINAAGRYTLQGVLEDGQIVVSEDIKKSDEVTITLNGVAVTSSDSAPFNAANGKITLELAENTDNIFSDTNKYGGYTTKSEPKGCVYSKRDLDISGAGVLTVNGNVKNGIVSGGDLKFKKGANITVTAKNNAVKGDNGVEFTAKTGNVNITSTDGDGIKSDALESVETDGEKISIIEKAGKGYVTIAGGKFNITAGGDGIQADNYCEITGGDIVIVSGAEGIKANEVNIPVMEEADDGYVPVVDDNGEPMYISGKIIISGGKLDITSGEDGIKAADSVIISDDADVTVAAEGTKAGDGSGYDAVQAGETTETITEKTNGSTIETTVVLAGVVEISGGSLMIKGASDDGIVSTGAVIISGGSVSGNAKNDFIKAYDAVEITGGDIDIVSGCDGIQSGKALTETVTGSTSEDSGYTAGNINISGGNITIKANGGYTTKLSDNSDSCKGIKAVTDLNISGGTIDINSADDSVHSNYNVTITGGKLNLSSGDDGVHADYRLVLGKEGGSDDDFTIDIASSYEGIEGSVIEQLSGTTYICASDDAINGAGDYTENGEIAASLSAGPGGWGGGPNQGGDDSAPYGMIYIKGGNLYAEAGGDGLDSNGSIEMSGGVVIINGPTSGGNGVFDIGDSGAHFYVTGGTLIGAGTSDMPVTPTVTGQGYILSSGGSSGFGGSQRPGSGSGANASSSVSITKGSPVKVQTDSGNMVFIPKVSGAWLFMSDPDMAAGKTYTASNISSYGGGETVLGKTENGTFYGLVINAD
ncbi:MAG: carbohydrate-binding domain-containing protein [Oscillospiraceae bacterium]|nr:carbohydrate-binding domain-containing protein [Oscillospiraceae bacterium]